MTSVEGTFAACGPNRPFSLSFTCTGPNCHILGDFPNTTCTTLNGSVIHCNNGVTCEGTVNYTSQFSFSQITNLVSRKNHLTLPNCEMAINSNGSVNGVSFDQNTCDSSAPNVTDCHAKVMDSHAKVSHS